MNLSTGDRAQLKIELEHLTGTMTWRWISFADDERPEGERFLGGCVVYAPGNLSAIREAHKQGCNPGGQALVIAFPEDVDLTQWGNRLLTRDEIEQFDQWMTTTYPRP